MQTSITKEFKFEAAHFLPNHDGKCRNLHGHSYVLYVSVKGQIIESGPKEGMVMDFADISKIVKENIIEKWDHQNLNEVLGFTTTAENLAVECMRILTSFGLDVSEIKLYETATSCATVTK